MACECISKPPFWFEERCKECLEEESKAWADAMNNVDKYVKLLRREE